jgi:predicted nucleic acid-binding protein
LRPTETVLLWQVASEFLNQLRRWQSKGALTADATAAAFQNARAMFTLRIPTENVFQVSFDLRARFSLSHWDSMLLAACKEAGVTTLYSEDMDAGTDYDGLKIVNPFI